MDCYTALIIAEMIGVNIFSTYTCSKRKTSFWGSPFTVCIVTAAFSVLLLLILIQFPAFGSFTGKGAFIPFGLLYLLPMLVFFDQPVKHMLIILCSSCIYTTFVFSIAVHCGWGFAPGSLSVSVLLAQSILFACTLPYYIRFVNTVFVYIHRNIEPRMLNSILVISMTCFLLFFLLNYGFVEGTSSWLELTILILFMVNALTSYRLIYDLVFVNHKAVTLSNSSKTDSLTGLKNRQGLYEDAQLKLNSRKPFTIIFADLDAFKSVNDNYGHATGDLYLIEFVRSVQALLEDQDGFYRLHGDEFVILTESPDPKDLCERMKKIEFGDAVYGVGFRGLSLGDSSYPADGDKLSDLLYNADLRMYQVKKQHHKLQ